MLCRLWAKIHELGIKTLDEYHQGPWGATIRGSSALRAASLSASCSRMSERQAAAIRSDVTQLHDDINATGSIQRATDAR